MDIAHVNKALQEGAVDEQGVLPHLDGLRGVQYIFKPSFGLDTLPQEPGLLLIRGPRQYGKSTWLESEIKKSISMFGPGSTYYLNGDFVENVHDLERSIHELTSLFSTHSKVKRLFIDEITAIDSWELALKRLADKGRLRDILIISTGSKAKDLRRGSERLPGRKGKLARNNYLFTPVSFNEFKRVCGEELKSDVLSAYILSGGCPIACNEITIHHQIPEYIITMIRDWIYGECAMSGKSRDSLISIMNQLIQYGGNPVGYSKLARNSGMANNTVAAGYIELLADLMTVSASYAWDAAKHVSIKGKQCKFHFINVLAAIVWYPARIRSIHDFNSLSGKEKSKFYEWIVGQELWRRAALKGEEIPELMNFWQSDDREIDYVVNSRHMIEVKLGQSTPMEFGWFSNVFPKAHLEVINTRPFQTEQIRGLSLEEFLSA